MPSHRSGGPRGSSTKHLQPCRPLPLPQLSLQFYLFQNKLFKTFLTIVGKYLYVIVIVGISIVFAWSTGVWYVLQYM